MGSRPLIVALVAVLLCGLRYPPCRAGKSESAGDFHGKIRPPPGGSLHQGSL